MAVSKNNSPEENKKCVKSYERLADQIVFIKLCQSKASNDSRQNFLRDAEKNRALRNLVHQRFSQIYPIQFTEEIFTHYQELLRAYVKLKHHRVSQLVKKMQQLLVEIQSGWLAFEINPAILQTLSKQKQKEADPKNAFLCLLTEFQNLVNKDLIKVNSLTDLKIFPVNEIFFHFNNTKKPTKSTEKLIKKTPEDLIIEINESKNKCLETLIVLRKFLSQMSYDEAYFQTQLMTDLKTAITKFNALTQNPVKSKEDVQKVEEIFKRLNFPENATFIEELTAANIPHSVTKHGPNLNSLRTEVMFNLKAQLENDLENQVEILTRQAEDELCIRYVQNALQNNADASHNLRLLGEIYHMGLDQPPDPKLVSPWEIYRTQNCRSAIIR